MDMFDIEKADAEKLVLRVMEPIRKAMTENRPDDGESWDNEREIVFTLAQIRELDKDLGAIGLTLANRYREQAEFRLTLTVAAQENIRLFGAVSAMSELLEKEKKQSQSLASALGKEQNVNTKLKEISGFKSTI